MTCPSCRIYRPGVCLACLDSEGSASGMSPAEFFEAGRIEGAERALLERDVGDVAWEVRWLRARVAFLLGLAETLEKDALEAHYAHQDDVAYLCRGSATQKRNEARGHQAKMDDCEAWLARAKAVLG